MPQIQDQNLQDNPLQGNPHAATRFVGQVNNIDVQHFGDEQETMREIQRAMENMGRTTVVWNPFRAQNNLSTGGTYGDSGIATIEQFVPYVLFLRKVPQITPKRLDEQSILMGESAVGSDVAQINKTAAETAETLLKIHGATGVSLLSSLAANDFKQTATNLLVYEIVMSAWNKQGLLEDLPEYFGVRSPLLPEKYDAVAGDGRDNSFTMTAEEVLLVAAKDGVKLSKVYSDLFKFEPKFEKFLDSPCVLNAKEIAIGKQLITELRNAALKMHEYAVGAEGVLPKTKEHLESVKRGPTFGKQKLDELDRYLMLHFPSYPMDTEIEKSEKNQRRGMEAMMRNMPGRGDEKSQELLLLKERNKLLEQQNEMMFKRLDALEKGQKT